MTHDNKNSKFHFKKSKIHRTGDKTVHDVSLSKGTTLASYERVRVITVLDFSLSKWATLVGYEREVNIPRV